jgi:hypothetical protein
VLDLVAERAPKGFNCLEDVITSAELADIVGGYARSDRCIVRLGRVAHRLDRPLLAQSGHSNFGCDRCGTMRWK